MHNALLMIKITLQLCQSYHHHHHHHCHHCHHRHHHQYLIHDQHLTIHHHHHNDSVIITKKRRVPDVPLVILQWRLEVGRG